MMCFPAMLLSAAEQAGMKVPPDPDNFSDHEYPHFRVFCNAQLGRAMTVGEHWENAKIIAAIPEDKIMEVTFPDLLGLGLHIIT